VIDSSIKFFFIGLACLFITNAGAQDSIAEIPKPELPPFSFPWQIKSLGKKALAYGDTYTAIQYFESFHKLRPKNQKANYQLAELHRLTRNYKRALELYEIIIESDNATSLPESWFRAAQMKKNLQDYEGAEEDLKKFKKQYKYTANPKAFKKLYASELKGIELVKSLKDSAPDAIVEHLKQPINNAHIEFAPIPVDENKFIYGSLKSDTATWISLVDSAETGMPVRKFYVAERKEDNGPWEHKGEFEGPFNDDIVNVGNGVLSEDGNRFFFSKCDYNEDKKLICAIYQSSKEGGRWSTPKKLGIGVNDPNFSSSQPAIGTDSKKKVEVLYFVSDRPRGKGGRDIWSSQYHPKKKYYKKAKNAGSKLNTPGDEITPYYDMATRRMYFSTDGHPNIGGLDIYVADGEVNKWSNLRNLGYPLNSSYDDVEYTLSKKRSEGFFTSNREGAVSIRHSTCCDDIYSFKLTEYIDIKLCGGVFEGESGESTDEKSAIDGVKVKLMIFDTTDQSSAYATHELSTENGSYCIKLEQGMDYKIVYEKDGYFSKTIDLSTKDIKESTELTRDDVWLKHQKQPIVLENILYEFNKASLTGAAKIAIDTTLYPILMNNPRIIIELGAHTDSKGSDKYNQDLSQRRAESVVKYLIKKGIPKDRVQARGYGESVPIAPNENADGSDNPDGRAKNRRTDFKVVGQLEEGYYLIDDEDE